MSATELRDFWNGHHQSDNHPLKLCVVFDNGASARFAKRLLKRIAPDETFETTLLRLEEDLIPPNGSNSARAAADAELLVVALAHDGELSAFAKAWFDLWISLCDDNHECALVALLTRKMSPAEFQSRWATFLESLAGTANLTFFFDRACECGGAEMTRASVPEMRLSTPPSKLWI